MKIHVKKLLCSSSFVVILLCFCWAAKSGDSTGPVGPNVKTIGIIFPDKHFGLDELDKTAHKHIWGASGPPPGAVLQTMVHIFPRDQTNMCEFTYSAGFAKPYWRVKIGYDGKVRNVEKGIKREG